MSSAETPDQTAARIVSEARAVASKLPFDERANRLFGHSVGVMG